MKDMMATMLQGGSVPAEPSEGIDGEPSGSPTSGERGRKIDGVFYPKKERQIDRLGFEVTKHALHFHGTNWGQVLSTSRDDLTREFIQGAADATREPEEHIQEVRFLCKPNYLDAKCTIRHSVHITVHEIQKVLSMYDWRDVKKLYLATSDEEGKGGRGLRSKASGMHLNPPPAPTHAAHSGSQKEEDKFMANFRSHFLKESRDKEEATEGTPVVVNETKEKKNNANPLQPRLSQAGVGGLRKGSLQQTLGKHEGEGSNPTHNDNELGKNSSSKPPRHPTLRHHHAEDGREGARRLARELSEYGRANVGPDGIDFPEKGKDMDEEPEMIGTRQTSTTIPVTFTT